MLVNTNNLNKSLVILLRLSVNGRSLKLVDKFTYPGNNVSSTKNDINTWLAKACTDIDRLSAMWRSDLADEMQLFSKQQSCQYYYMDAPHGRWLSVLRKSLTAIAQQCCELYWTNPRGNIPQNCSCTTTYHLSQKPSWLDEEDMWDTAGEVRTNS